MSQNDIMCICISDILATDNWDTIMDMKESSVDERTRLLSDELDGIQRPGNGNKSIFYKNKSVAYKNKFIFYKNKFILY